MLISAIFFTGNTHPPVNSIQKSSKHFSSIGDYGKALGLCLIAVSFSYAGYAQTINFGGEVKNAKKIIPKGIMLGLSIIVILYIALNYVYVQVIGFKQLQSAESIAAILAGKVFGKAGFNVLSIIIFFSVMGYVNVNLLSNPRALFAMAQDGVLPKIFAKTQSKNQVLVVSLSVFTLLTVGIIFFAKTFDKILNYTIFLECISMAGSAATLFILRKKTAHLDKKTIYRVPLYPLLPSLFIAAYLFVGFSIYRQDAHAALNGLIIFLTFIAIYFSARLLKQNI